MIQTTINELNDLRAALARAGHDARHEGGLLAFRDTYSGRVVRIIHHDEEATFEKFDAFGAVIGEHTVPAGWRAVVVDEGRTLCEGASLAGLRDALAGYLPTPIRRERNPFEGPFSNRANDELSTEHVTAVEDVHPAGGELIGQTGASDEPRFAGCVARTAAYAVSGDVPGQITGWAGLWHTRTAAEDALRSCTRRVQARR
jgi:hypothetical protein